MDDLMGVFGNGNAGSNGGSMSMAGGGGFGGSMSDNDIMNGFAGMDLSGSQGQGQQQEAGKKTNEDLLSLF